MESGTAVHRSQYPQAEACGVDAILFTTNAQIYGDREWEARVQIDGKPTPSAAFDATLHPRWAATTLTHGLPSFTNVIDFIRRGTDILKALALGADTVLTGRATLYGLCAHGADGVQHALQILHDETHAP